MKKIRVLIVDDSAVIRMTLAKTLNNFSDIEVVATASDPYIARDKILRTKPDVVTLDIQMPRMDGLTFLKRLMAYYPIPVVMVSALTKKGCETTLNCLAAGAVDFVTKPSSFEIEGSQEDMINELADKIRIAYRAKVTKRGDDTKGHERRSVPLITGGMIKNKKKIIAIGASTGGTEALTSILSRMPHDSPPILIVQHMPAHFTATFADRLNNQSPIEVKEARDNDKAVPGRAIIAPGDYHMVLKRDSTRYYVRVEYGPPVKRHRPSIEILFNSVARYAGSNSIGVILTGMGDDGAQGLLEMKNAGAKTIAQDEYSCIVFGMPKEAIKLGAVDKVVNLSKIPEMILAML